ncbi:TrmH family RNA methyltransferase [Pseudomonas saudiphocaensis]|jgi:TrmH family RNA methyltransferase|uniref:TrmH family RNA methyltransferase n=1 Tax=Pseudomonas saudiphocaensis TaxID=1499686 RepID=UPI000F76A236|nr:RNA methyltransferase [Pseudomonas saudiphocaensis]RRV13715.1 RNA methyltransferase [Pseudomonas saudiphocaensis]
MKLDDIKKLQQKKYRAEFGHFLVEGEHLVLELQKAALHNPLLQRSQLYVTGAYEHWQSPFRTQLISDRQMAQIADTKTPQGIIAVVPMPETAAPAAAAGERAIYLHEIQDPGNLGTILRTLAWFGSFRCLLSPGSVDPYNPKVVRSSMGAIFHAPLELDVELDSLPGRFQRIACLDMHGDSLQSADFKTFDCYLFGNEARGVPREQLSALGAKPFTIAGSGAIESLNLATTVNICAYELNR